MDPNSSRLVAEQIDRMLDVLAARFSALDTRFEGLEARFDALDARLARWEERAGMRLDALERSQADQETRLRAAGESITRLTATTSLAQAGQAAFALILSALAAYLSRR